MSYNKSTDFQSIQKDVLSTDTTTNSSISKLKQFKTNNKTVLGAVNENYNRLNNIAKQVADALAKAEEALGKATYIQNDEFIPDENQVSFVLSKTPNDQDNILFYINGIKYSRDDIKYISDTNTIEWLSAEQLQLGPKHSVSVVYTHM